MNSEVLLSAPIGLGHHPDISVPPAKPGQVWAMGMMLITDTEPFTVGFSVLFCNSRIVQEPCALVPLQGWR